MPSLPIARMFAARTIVRIVALALVAGSVNVTAAVAETSPPQFVATQIPPERIDAAVASLDGVASDLMKRSGIPGMAIAVVRGGKTVYAKGFGVRKVGEAAPVDADTVFQIASLSKSLSASVVAQQVGAGAVTWDTPIVCHLPWFRLADPWVTRHVTIADMFSHRSGLPDHAGDDLEDLGYGRRAILERLRLLPLDSFRNTYAYTNYGITAGAEAVAAAAGKSWESLAEEVLYKPLGMTSTSERYADYARQPNRALLHVQVDGRFQAKFTRDADAQSAAGGVSSTVNDLARWMAFVLQDGAFEGRQVVPAAALLPAARAEMISSPSAAMDARPSFYGYGIGVSITSSGRVALDHSGAFSRGASTNYRMLPAQGLGIVILTNAAPTGVAEAIGADFMDRVETGQPTRDWYAAYAPIMTRLNAPAGSLVGKSPPAVPQPSARLAAYAGTYGNAYFGPATVSRIDGGLELKLGPSGTRYRLSHWTGNTFAFHPSAENETIGSQAAISFKMGGKGHAQDFTIDYLNELGLGRFVRQ